MVHNDFITAICASDEVIVGEGIPYPHYIGGLQWVEVLWTSVQVEELYWWLVITVNRAVHSQHGARSRILVQVNTNKEEGGWAGECEAAAWAVTWHWHQAGDMIDW